MKSVTTFSTEKILDTFNFQNKEYPLYSIVKLNDKGRKALCTNLKCVQICNHTQSINDVNKHYWYYITSVEVYSHSKNNNIWLCPTKTQFSPDEILEEVVVMAPLPGVKENAQNKNAIGYWHTETVWEWIKCIGICLCGCIFSGWLIKICIWLGAIWYCFCKCEKIHSQYITASFNTFESKWKITKSMAINLYLNSNNRHSDTNNLSQVNK